MMNHGQPIVDQIRNACVVGENNIAQFAGEVLALDDNSVTSLLQQLATLSRSGQISQLAEGWSDLFGLLLMRLAQQSKGQSLTLSEPYWTAVIELYRALDKRCPTRYRLLQQLAATNDQAILSTLAVLLCEDAPEGEEAAATLAPLLHPYTAAAVMFPRIMACLENVKLAAAVIDLANYLCRHELCTPHPMAASLSQLIRFLDGVTVELERLQSTELDGADLEQARQRAVTGIPLATALCDALALIGDSTAQRVLHTTLQLQHRRLRVEAAAALARLRDDAGTKALLAAASVPATRLRAIEYAKELGIEEQLDEQFTAPVAIAEAELISYLAEPKVFGLAPTSCELLDCQTMYWPGYEEPRMCYLFRYSYSAMLEDRVQSYSNIGIAGPATYALPANLEDLPTEDVYAAYAGWQAEHPEIKHSMLEPHQTLPAKVQSHLDRTETDEFESLQPTLLGNFFGDTHIVANARKEGANGAVVIDADQLHWFSGVEASDAYHIYKGRRLLRQFNP